MAFDLSDYVDVAERISILREKYPNASLQPLNHAHPYTIETIGDSVFVVYTAACYRSPDDPTPGVGTAWEPFPGRTPYTKDSEVMVAETSAWGRAIVAALAADTKRGVASQEEVRNRQTDSRPSAPRPQSGALATEPQLRIINRLVDKTGMVPETWPLPADFTKAAASKLIDELQAVGAEPAAARVATVRTYAADDPERPF